jgi:hypothetical protein
MKKTTLIIIVLIVLVALAVLIIGAKSCSRNTDAPAVEDRDGAVPEPSAAAEPPVSADEVKEANDAETETATEEAAPAETEPPAVEETAPPEENDTEERAELGDGGIVGGTPSEPTVVPITEDTAWTEWDTFISLSPDQQDAFMQSFENIDAFVAWMTSAQAEWAAAHPMEEIGPGSVIDFSGQ